MSMCLIYICYSCFSVYDAFLQKSIRFVTDFCKIKLRPERDYNTN